MSDFKSPLHSRTPIDVEAAIAELQQELKAAGGSLPHRIDCNSENLEQGLARLVLSLVELLRRLLERQAIRRMEGQSLTPEQVEEMGLALMKLEAKVNEIAHHFGLTPKDLNLELGPLGNLLDSESEPRK
jgi:CII-binding regulator of phage lambda lysogenization HflD